MLSGANPVVLARPRRVTALLASLLAVVLLVAACSSGGDAKPGPGGGPSLTVGAILEPPTLDPSLSDAAPIPQALLDNVYETLIKLGVNGAYDPLLAEKYTVSADRKTYTFTLRPTAVFASGHPVTAADVAWSIRRFQTGKNLAAKSQQSVVSSVATPDAHTVTVQLKHPSNSWLFNEASTAGIVFDRSAAANLSTAPAGSGPYQLDRWSKGSDLLLKRIDRYWGTKATFQTAQFRYFTDPNAMNSAMMAGQLDVLSSVQAPQALDQFKDPSRYTVIDGTTDGEVVLAFNDSAKPLTDRRVRQAINYAIDRRALITTVWAGKGTLIGSMVPPTDPWYTDLSGTYPYDPAKARALLAQAGYPKGLTLRMRLPVIPYAQQSGQFVASQLKAVGITAKIEELDFARWLDQVFLHADYDLTIVNHVEARDIVKYADPQYYWRYRNAQVQRLVAAADAGTPAQQVADLRQVSMIITHDAAADWLFLFPNLIVTKASVKGVPKDATTLSFDLSTITKAG